MYWLFHWFVKITGFIPQLFAFRKKIYYEDKAKQGRYIKGKAVLVSNHHDLMDYPLMMFVFWNRTLRCQMAELLYEKNFVMTALITLLGGVKVDRNTHDFSFIEKSSKILKKKGIIEIFPEARLPKEGEQTPLPFKPSAVYLALLNDAPIIPVYTNGSYVKKERARVMIGKPFYTKDMYDSSLSEKENVALISEKLREKVIWLRDEVEKQVQKEKKNK